VLPELPRQDSGHDPHSGVVLDSVLSRDSVIGRDTLSFVMQRIDSGTAEYRLRMVHRTARTAANMSGVITTDADLEFGSGFPHRVEITNEARKDGVAVEHHFHVERY
jgi:hypothetical protein